MTTSWNPVDKWYDQIVGKDGHYYHRNLIIPNLLRLLNLPRDGASLLDIGCGQGILARHIPKTVRYTGIDLSPKLIAAAQKHRTHAKQQFLVADATKPLLLKETFTHAAILLALQNMEEPEKVLMHLSKVVKGKVVIVLNHPCFRIPRQSSWGNDEQKKLQYRRIDRYSSPLKIPIQAHPGKGKQSATTYTFHHSLQDYFRMLHDAGFAVTGLEEWHSDKMSTGKAAKQENRARLEFPLFLALVCQGKV